MDRIKLAAALTETKGLVSIEPPSKTKSYSVVPWDPKSGNYEFSGPDNGWYTFSGTLSEDVYSEADGSIISGVHGPLHQSPWKIECCQLRIAITRHRFTQNAALLHCSDARGD